jgi:hypothetical protein
MLGGNLPVRGVHGEIRWSYYLAARVHGYALTYANQQWRLVATLVEPDAFKLAQRPLIFAAPTRRAVMRWPIVSYTRRGDSFSAELGTPIP